MAHFAQIENNIVVRVLVVNNQELMENGIEVEAKGIAFLQSIFPNTNWVQTSYNGKFRKNYAGQGYSYDPVLDAFIEPKPFPSWTLEESSCQWIPPYPMPVNGKAYTWNEDSQQWQEVNQNL